jgi:hypothetical protein
MVAGLSGGGHSVGTIHAWQHWRTTAAGQGDSHWCVLQWVLRRLMILTLRFGLLAPAVMVFLFARWFDRVNALAHP